LVERRHRGLNLLRRRLPDAATGYVPSGGYELLDDPAVLDRLGELNDFLRPAIGADVFFAANEKIKETGMAGVRAMAKNVQEGTLHSGKTCRALMRYVAEKGGTTLTGCVVRAIEPDGDGVTARVSSPGNGREHIFRFRAACVCTNAYARELLPELEVVPARGLVLVTAPVPGLRLHGSFHWDEGFYYFRDLDGRVLLGGGRNLDFDSERTLSLEGNPSIFAELERRMRETILPYAPNIEIEHRGPWLAKSAGACFAPSAWAAWASLWPEPSRKKSPPRSSTALSFCGRRENGVWTGKPQPNAPIPLFHCRFYV
jgi:glycine/D-amino acid oxidase-like deaminating enzyme